MGKASRHIPVAVGKISSHLGITLKKNATGLVSTRTRSMPSAQMIDIAPMTTSVVLRYLEIYVNDCLYQPIAMSVDEGSAGIFSIGCR